MKRILLLVLLSSLVVTSFSSVGDAQRRRRRAAAPKPPAGKSAVRCPRALNDISDCPDTGCGPSLDPLLNERKNIRADSQSAVTKDLQDLKDLPDPVTGFKVGDTREKLTALGEGDKITVVAYALVARKGGGESCNCKLLSVADTDNHIVLVDEAALALKGRTLKAALELRERDSITAEFAPRVRLDHPNLLRGRLQPLIDVAPHHALQVRITGLLMFDSEHSLGHHLKRHNNWEVHPVMGLEYCPAGKTCAEDSDANWVDLERE